MQKMTYLFHEIAKIIIAKLIYIKLINNKHKCKLKNIINLKKFQLFSTPKNGLE